MCAAIRDALLHTATGIDNAIAPVHASVSNHADAIICAEIADNPRADHACRPSTESGAERSFAIGEWPTRTYDSQLSADGTDRGREWQIEWRVH